MRPAHALTLLALLTAAGCQQRLADDVDPDAVEWVPYRNDALGVAFEHPSTWTPDQRGSSIALRDAHATAMRVTLVDREEAVGRGLWGRTPLVRVDTIGGLSFAFYRYDHYDGPTYVPTLAFVGRHRNRELGVEFRTRRPAPDATELRILATLRLF